MALRKTGSAASRRIVTRRLAVPKGFPLWTEEQGGGSRAGRFVFGQLLAPSGSVILHGILLLGLAWGPAPKRQYPLADAPVAEWVWLPEIVLATDAAIPPIENPPPANETARAIDPAEPVPTDISRGPAPAEAAIAEVSLPVREESTLSASFEEVSAPSAVVAAADLDSPEMLNAWAAVRAELVRNLRYPAQARRQRLRGVVRIRLQMTEAGEVTGLEFLPPAPPELLRQAVGDAVRRLGRFPAAGEALRRGQIPACAELAIRFALS